MTPEQLLQLIDERVERKLAEREHHATGYIATISSSHTTGNPALKLPKESAAGTKTDRIIKPYDGITRMPAASDVVAIDYDRSGGRIIKGKVDDVGSDFWVAPGNTQLLAADTERSTTSATFVDAKKFTAFRPGRYRLTFDLARTGGTAKAQVQFELPDGTRVLASGEETSVSNHPAYTAKTLDMTVTAPVQSVIVVQIKNDGGGTAYIQNCKLKYTNAAAIPAHYNAVITD